jgi:hypothetical protein
MVKKSPPGARTRPLYLWNSLSYQLSQQLACDKLAALNVFILNKTVRRLEDRGVYIPGLSFFIHFFISLLSLTELSLSFSQPSRRRRGAGGGGATVFSGETSPNHNKINTNPRLFLLLNPNLNRKSPKSLPNERIGSETGGGLFFLSSGSFCFYFLSFSFLFFSFWFRLFLWVCWCIGVCVCVCVRELQCVWVLDFWLFEGLWLCDVIGCGCCSLCDAVTLMVFEIDEFRVLNVLVLRLCFLKTPFSHALIFGSNI